MNLILTIRSEGIPPWTEAYAVPELKNHDEANLWAQDLIAAYNREEDSRASHASGAYKAHHRELILVESMPTPEKSPKAAPTVTPLETKLAAALRELLEDCAEEGHGGWDFRTPPDARAALDEYDAKA